MWKHVPIHIVMDEVNQTFAPPRTYSHISSVQQHWQTLTVHISSMPEMTWCLMNMHQTLLTLLRIWRTLLWTPQGLSSVHQQQQGNCCHWSGSISWKLRGILNKSVLHLLMHLEPPFKIKLSVMWNDHPINIMWKMLEKTTQLATSSLPMKRPQYSWQQPVWPWDTIWSLHFHTWTAITSFRQWPLIPIMLMFWLLHAHKSFTDCNPILSTFLGWKPKAKWPLGFVPCTPCS